MSEVKINKTAYVSFAIEGEESHINNVIAVLKKHYGLDCEPRQFVENIKVFVTHQNGSYTHWLYTKEFGLYPFTKEEVKFTSSKIKVNTRRSY